MKYGYQRVSTLEQSTERQLEGLELDAIYEDKLSGRNRDRPQLKALLVKLNKGDEVYVHEISRLSRSLIDLQQIINEIVGKGASITFKTENMLFDGSDNPIQEAMMQMLGTFAQLQRSMIVSATKEGVAIAKAAGKMKGSKPTIDRDAVAGLVKSGMNNSQVSKALNISVMSVNRIKKELGLSGSKPAK